jgi:hypothetical protein
MTQYTVVNSALFMTSGVLGLTKEQYEPRKRVLKPLSRGRYEITGEVCFKIGEKIAFDSPASKGALANLEEVKETKAGPDPAVAR